MFFTPLTFLALAASSLGASEANDRREDIEKRQGQNNIPQLLSLASLAGITSLPTDPAVLLRLGPLANQLASALPTSPVLSALQTAAPSDFVSNIVNNPTFASSFESAFAAGSSPSWFNNLPTSVRSYLHTYTGFAGLATAAGQFRSVTSSAGKGSETSGTSASKTATPTSESTGGASSSAAEAASTASSSVAAAGSAVTTSATPGIAASGMGVVGVGFLVGVVGILGVVVVL